MKKLVVVLVASLLVQFSYGQQEKKDSYVLNGDRIEATLYHDNGVIAQTGFYTKQGALEGEWISYDAQGNKTAVAQYENGAKVGTWLFYIGENLKEVTYKDSRIAEVKTYKITDTRVVSN